MMAYDERLYARLQEAQFHSNEGWPDFQYLIELHGSLAIKSAFMLLFLLEF